MDEADTVLDRALTRTERRKFKRWNEQVKLGSNICHSLALAVVGFGFLRFVFEPGGVVPGLAQSISVLTFGVAAEASAFYILSRTESES